MCAWASRYIWLPGNVNDDIGEFKIEWHDLYSIDVKTGVVSYPEGKTYEAEDGQWTGSASATVCVSTISTSTVASDTNGLDLNVSQQPACSGNKIVKDSKFLPLPETAR